MKKFKRLISDHPIWSFLLIGVGLTLLTLLLSGYLANAKGNAIFKLFAEGDSTKLLGQFALVGDFLGGTIGNVVALAGSFVAIMIATNSYLINKKDLFREEVLFLEEKISPACRKIVELKNHIDNLIIAAKKYDELLSENTEIDDERANSAEEKLRGIRRVIEIIKEIEGCSDVASTYALYILKNNNKTKIWFEYVKGLEDMITVEVQGKWTNETFKLKPNTSLLKDKTIYSAELSYINLLKKINSYKVTETDIRDSISNFIDLNFSPLLEFIIRNNLLRFDSKHVDISNTFNFKDIILKNSSYYEEKIKTEIDLIEGSNLINLKDIIQEKLKYMNSDKFYFELLNKDEESREAVIIEKIKNRVIEEIKRIEEIKSEPPIDTSAYDWPTR